MRYLLISTSYELFLPGFAVAAGNISESENKNVLALAGETNIINDSTNQDGTLDTYFRVTSCIAIIFKLSFDQFWVIYYYYSLYSLVRWMRRE